MKITQHRKWHNEAKYFHQFTYVNEPSCGRIIYCDEGGEIFSPQECDRFHEAKSDPKLKYEGISKTEWTWVEPAIGLCNWCNREVALAGFTNTCECGTDYNMSGQELAPREQWGEETGESVADILAVDYGRDEDW